jgi:hypothetical protein|uniref:YpkH n=1 Tax=Corynebacterium jeikeium TaxID=38289 RepID=Q8RLM7_CORJE|nr:YpkH [Corynebacterium jeikeium]
MKKFRVLLIAAMSALGLLASSPIALAGNGVPTMGSSPSYSHSAEVPTVTNYAKSTNIYVGPFKYGWECKISYTRAKLTVGVARECRKHADGKWWYIMRVQTS